jgi:hypothetical protein
MKKQIYKWWALSILAGFIFYSAAMIVLRLRMTEMGYQFEELKTYERSLKEEQLRLRANLAKKLSPQQLRLQGFAEPESRQVVAIP